MREDTRKSILSSYRPALVPLADNVSAAVFPLMKLYPAEYCIRSAASMGLIGPDTLIVESSSGTMALGLALVCRALDYKLAIVSDYCCDAALRRRLEDLKATVEIVSGPAPIGGYQRARLDRVHAICNSAKNPWWVNQYDNLDNSASYEPFAEQLIESAKRIDCLVAPVGSGGSSCGTARFLRQKFADVTLVGVDTFGSVLFGQPDLPRKLRGLGNSLFPRNLDHTAFDEIHWVSAAEANLATRRLHQETTLFRGATSGASWMVAQDWAARHPQAKVVCVFPDEGYRYMDSVYDDEYLHKNGLWISDLPRCPYEVLDPLDAGPEWSFMRWSRRSYRQATGHDLVVTTDTPSRAYS